MSGTSGYVNPSNGTGISYDVSMDTSYQSFIGPQKVGGVNDSTNSVAGAAIRQKSLSFDLTSATQASIAHGCTYSDGTPATPVSVQILYTNSATVHSSAAPDSTNIYLTDANAGTTAATGKVVVVY